MFHVHNGDCSAEIARRSSIPGEHFSWREALVVGPAPANRDVAEWLKLRARHLAEAYGLDPAEVEKDLAAEEEQLRRSTEHDEVVLWFEHDLFCQINLIYLLNWFGDQSAAPANLSLICIGDFPGKQNFRGLGELAPEEMAALFPNRQQVTPKHFAAARSAWNAYCSRDPTDIQSLLETDLETLPFLHPALQAHMRRFPSTRNGLGRIENRALKLVASGTKDFANLFSEFQDAEPAYGFGDAQFWLALRQLIHVSQPLLATSGNMMSDIEPAASFEITEVGRSVAGGEADFVNLNGINQWLGGVYLEDDRALWRWDEAAEKLVYG